MLPGVYQARRKDGSIYYRSSLTYNNKHISLGSFASQKAAHQAYTVAGAILRGHESIEESFYNTYALAFEKIVSLINFRDNKLYIASPIYLRKNYFSYYLDISTELKFDIDDLFYFSSHRIIRRGRHLYVNDYGMQISLHSRYGIKSHAVLNRDYEFVNNDPTDFRYSNIRIINPYHGVSRVKTAGLDKFVARIHINGNYIVGTFNSPEKAAIAYNKAIDLAHSYGIEKNFPENYLHSLSAREYADIYSTIRISNKYIDYLKGLPG